MSAKDSCWSTISYLVYYCICQLSSILYLCGLIILEAIASLVSLFKCYGPVLKKNQFFTCSPFLARECFDIILKSRDIMENMFAAMYASKIKPAILFLSKFLWNFAGEIVENVL